MEIRLIAPDNLDIDQIIAENPFEKGTRMKRDYLVYLIDTVMKQRAAKDDEYLEKLGKCDSYVPLHSKTLEKRVPKYATHLEYLQVVGILECDEQYSPGKVSKGYRLVQKYVTSNFRYVTIDDFILCQKIRHDKPLFDKKESQTKHGNLWNWFQTGNLKIDLYGCFQFIDKMEAEEKEAILLNSHFSKTTREGRLMALQQKCRNFKIQVSGIGNEEYFFHIDDTGKRLHTNLTNLSKDFRQFLTYDGQSLVAVDIKNSQPYMSLPLLTKEFWKIGKSGTLGLKFQKIIGKREGKEGSIRKSIPHSIIMFCDSSETLYRSDFQKQKYVENVVNGTIYECLADIMEKEGLIDPSLDAKSRRDRAKKMMITLLFDKDTKSYNQFEKSPCQVFQREFYSVAKIFSLIKQANYNTLAILLQRIESHLVLDVICKRIATERPNLPIFTIHDSIVTTVGNENYIRQVMVEELQGNIGLAPQLSSEYWSKPNNHQNNPMNRLGQTQST